MIKIIDCPRDAMQGLKTWIPTEKKISYLQDLLAVNFNVLDCGSFVSPRLIPQLRDTQEVISNLDLSNTKTLLSVIVGNVQAAQMAMAEKNIHYIGFPFSVSEKFQQYNTASGIKEGLSRIKTISNMLQTQKKELLVYFSMCFGNPYGEPWSRELVLNYVAQMQDWGISKINLSDTVGSAHPEDISFLFSTLINTYPDIEFGAHFHATYTDWHNKVEAAYLAGCRSFDGALLGQGGCPMSKSDMLGNIPTEKLLSFANEHGLKNQINTLAFENAFNKALTLFQNS